ncbi:class II aldolase/adducin family protein [Novosphingobium aquimarinum]|uniref:class II aldolase/adducin family protein n=1 Tax=Novosphingobium aquimarinum TaxID=2682494 RepID=UPI0012EBF4F6|nr:class II aldolase/adducin family protein [Novosphingobium aquimarinum]
MTVQEDISEAEAKARAELAAAYRLAAHHGWDDGIGTHFSARVPGPETHFLLLPLGMMYEEVTATSLVKVDLDGNVVGGPEGARINRAGFMIHSYIHREIPEAHCVFHCHTVAGIAVGAQKRGLLPLSFHAMFLHDRLGYHDLEGVTVDEDEMPRMVEALNGKNGLILRNHGTLVAAPTIAEAFFYLFHLEKACEIQVAAGASSELIIPSNAMVSHFRSQVDAGFDYIAQLTWEAMLRKDERNGRRDPLHVPPIA